MLTDKGVSTYIWHVTCIYICVLCTVPHPLYTWFKTHTVITCTLFYRAILQRFFFPNDYTMNPVEKLPQPGEKRYWVIVCCTYDLLIDLYKRGKSWLCGNAWYIILIFVVFALCGTCIWYITACKGLPHNGLHSFSYSLPTVGVCRIHEVMCLLFPFSLEGTCRSQVYL